MAKLQHDPTQPVWSKHGLAIYVSADSARDVMVVCQQAVKLTKAEAFEMIHEVADRLRRFPRSSV